MLRVACLISSEQRLLASKVGSERWLKPILKQSLVLILQAPCFRKQQSGQIIKQISFLGIVAKLQTFGLISF